MHHSAIDAGVDVCTIATDEFDSFVDAVFDEESINFLRDSFSVFAGGGQVAYVFAARFGSEGNVFFLLHGWVFFSIFVFEHDVSEVISTIKENARNGIFNINSKFFQFFDPSPDFSFNFVHGNNLTGVVFSDDAVVD